MGVFRQRYLSGQSVGALAFDLSRTDSPVSQDRQGNGASLDHGYTFEEIGQELKVHPGQPVRSAPVRLVHTKAPPLRSALLRFAPLRRVCLSVASMRSAPVRFNPPRFGWAG
jgi:hypothetical protein